METKYTWDKKKAKLNRQSHGVSFDQAVQVFSDPFMIVQENILDGNEQRYHAIGAIGSALLLLVVFVDRSTPNVEIIHIISARQTERYERAIYEDQFQ